MAGSRGLREARTLFRNFLAVLLLPPAAEPAYPDACCKVCVRVGSCAGPARLH